MRQQRNSGVSKAGLPGKFVPPTGRQIDQRRNCVRDHQGEHEVCAPEPLPGQCRDVNPINRSRAKQKLEHVEDPGAALPNAIKVAIPLIDRPSRAAP